jgi:hypothetical protein
MTAPFDWSQCIFCKQKSYKKDRNLKRVESKDRVKNILHAANNKSDFDMVSLRQRHSFVLQLVQIFLNLFCLCIFHSRIYDTVSYQLESNQVKTAMDIIFPQANSFK